MCSSLSFQLLFYSDGQEPSPDALNRSAETYIEEYKAIIDTTGIKEAEIRTAFGNESVTPSGYQATQINIQDKSEIDVEIMKNYEKTKNATPKKATISNQGNMMVCFLIV